MTITASHLEIHIHRIMLKVTKHLIQLPSFGYRPQVECNVLCLSFVILQVISFWSESCFFGQHAISSNLLSLFKICMYDDEAVVKLPD